MRLTRYLSAAAAGLFAVAVALALTGFGRDPEPNAPGAAAPAPPPPLFAKTVPAANAPVLVLLPDDRGVSGWVAGGTSYAGKPVTVKAGWKAEPVIVRDDNTFRWDHRASRARTATFTVGGLTARTMLSPAPEAGRPSAFFVTDRSAYRPGHTLKFAAFLRTLTPDGEFAPVADRDVTVDLTSVTRQTRAVRLKLRSDSFGRVTGEYTFTDADALDHFALAADGYAGTARVLLGEYRKGKVGLAIAGAVKDHTLSLTFDTRDYLGRTVNGRRATYTATVTRTGDPGKLTLTPTGFVAPEPAPPSDDDLAGLPDDERLLTLANGVSAATFAGFGSRTVATREGAVTFDGGGPGKVELGLHPDWLKGHHTVTVTGVMLDDTGRENRSATTVDLVPAATRAVTVTTPRELVAAGEPLAVAVGHTGLTDADRPATTLIVVRLTANPGSPWFVPPAETNADDDSEAPTADNTRLPPLSAKPPAKADAWKTQPVFDPVRRAVVQVLPVSGGKAEAVLKQPGAYKLLALTRLADGTTLQAEAGVVVKSPAKLPGVVLVLDRREVNAGDRLRGVAHTRFAGAKLLLTLRDATGVRLTKPLTADANGVAVIDEPLPAGLRYGCGVSVQYPESATAVHADQRELFVVPTDRTVKLTAKVPGTVDAGADVAVEIAADRKEEMDLVVSVFDEALLGVAGDLSGNVRDFYLADARGINRAAKASAVGRFGTVTVAELVTRAEDLLKHPDAVAREPGLKSLLTGLVAHWQNRELRPHDLPLLVRLAGFEVYLAHPLHWLPPYNAKFPPQATLVDVLNRRAWPQIERDRPPGAVSVGMMGNTVLLGWQYRDGVGDPWSSHRAGLVSPDGSGQFGGIGNFGGNFGFAGGGLVNLGMRNNNLGVMGFGVAGVGGGGLGQFGMSHGFNRDFMGGNLGFSAGFNRDLTGGQGAFSFPAGGALPALGPAPGLSLGADVVRRDFADSAFWSAALRTDADGKAVARFKLPDSLTNWRVAVTAVTPKMHVGSGSATFKSSRQVMVWPMLPRAFCEGDTVRVFGTVHNLSDSPQDVKVHLKAENGAVLDAAERTVRVPAGGSVPVYWTYRAGKPGMTDLLMSVACPAGSDASLKRLPVTRAAVEERATASGAVGGELTLTLPEGFDPATSTASVTVAPTLAADLADTLPYLVEYPYGCVEQTMSRFLPAIRVSQILSQTGGSAMPELEKKLPKVVEAGVKRLLELQQMDGGWGWQGSGQTHEMMTPYALYGLLEAEQAGYPIPKEGAVQAGLARLRQYVNGALDPFGPPTKEVTRARQFNDALYCLSVLAHREPVSDAWWPWLERGVGHTAMSDYGHALALELAVKADKKDLAAKLAGELRKRAKKSADRVYWTTAGFSRWADNTNEVTAACLRALVAFDHRDPLIPGVLAFFHSTKRGDRWDSTKDTAVILYALCDYLHASGANHMAAGAVTVTVNGKPAGAVTLDGPKSKTLTVPAALLKPGANAVKVTAPAAASAALARATVRFTRGGAADVPARDHGIELKRTLFVRKADGTWDELKPGQTVARGSYVKVGVSVMADPGAGRLEYALVESPKPACGETIPADDKRFPRPRDQFADDGCVLREDRESMTCFHYERGGGLAWAEYVFLAEFAGTFRLPPARAELMYRPTVGGHSDGVTLTVTDEDR